MTFIEGASGVESLHQRYAAAAAEMQKVFGGDPALVHGPFNIGTAGKTELKPGHYNVLLPDPNIIPDGVGAVAIHCMDERTSFSAGNQVALELGIPVLQVTLGGGAAQPEANGFPRRQAVIDFAATFHELHPSAQIVLGCHTGKCGGCEYCTGGKMSQIIRESGHEGEVLAMNSYVQHTEALLTAAGVPKEKIRVFRADVDPATNLYAGLSWLE